VKIDEDLENFITQKEYVSLDKMKSNKKSRPSLLEEKLENSIQRRKVEIVDKDFLLNKIKQEKQNFLYDTPGVFNDSQVPSMSLLNYMPTSSSALCAYVLLKNYMPNNKIKTRNSIFIFKKKLLF